MTNRYLLTGSSGFIGSKVAEKLLDAGHYVTGIDNLNDAYDLRLKEWRLNQLINRAEFTFHPLDITRFSDLETLFANKFDAIINLAARAGVRHSVIDPWAYIETNVTGTLNLLELCKRYEIKKFILSSTSSLYGDSEEQPLREDSNTDLPLSQYAASKKSAELLCQTYHHLYDIDITVLRFFTVYGPAGRPDMSPLRFVQWISEELPVTVYGDGSQSRDFTYIDDIANGVILGLKTLGFQTINLGSDSPVRLMDFIRIIENLTGKSANILYQESHPSDVYKTWADINKAKKYLGWEPQTRIDHGLEKLVTWYNENRDWASTIITMPHM